MNIPNSEQPTPDSLALWCEFQEIESSLEYREFTAAQAEREALEKRVIEVNANIVALTATMRDRVSNRLDITPQVKAMRFEFREAALASKDTIHVAARISRALAALSEKIATLIIEE